MDWKQLYTSKNRPQIADIRAYLQPGIFALFARFGEEMKMRNLGFIAPRYTATHGWTYNYGRSGLVMLSPVTFTADFFTVCGIEVKNEESLIAALKAVDELYNNGFEERFAQFAAERTARRKAKAALPNAYDGEKQYMKDCVWCPKVSRSDLRRLYKGEAAGLLDEDLLDDIGLTLFVRCKEAKEIYDLMEVGIIRCRKCGAEHKCKSMAGIVECSCGAQYTYHSYRKSFREDNMPRGAASAVFDAFVADWSRAKTPFDKMRLIDNLVHEFHVAEISGSRGRPVGVNLISGTKTQIFELINELAYK